MILYHGSMVVVDKPRIIARAEGRGADFGIGFYTTSSYEQAVRWVHIRQQSLAMTVEMISKHEQIMPIKAMVNFYHSRTYSSLEKEATKFWWMSPLQLFREYEREMEEV